MLTPEISQYFAHLEGGARADGGVAAVHSGRIDYGVRHVLHRLRLVGRHRVREVADVLVAVRDQSELGQSSVQQPAHGLVEGVGVSGDNLHKDDR